MKKILFFFALCCIFTFVNNKAFAGCAPGETYVEVWASNDGSYAADNTVITVTIGGTVAYMGNPATDGSPTTGAFNDYIVLSGCFPEGATISVDYTDAAGNGILVDPPIFLIMGCDQVVDAPGGATPATGASGNIFTGTLPTDNDNIGAINPTNGTGAALPQCAGNMDWTVQPTSADATAAGATLGGVPFPAGYTEQPFCDVAGGDDTGNMLSGVFTMDSTEDFEVCSEWTQPNVTGNETGALIGLGLGSVELFSSTDVDGNGGVNDCGGGVTAVDVYDSAGALISSGTTNVTGLTPGATYCMCITGYVADVDVAGPDNMVGTADDGVTPAEGTCVLDGFYGTIAPYDLVVDCPDYNAISVAAGCNVFDICIGYVDTDMDGIGDGGEDPTGTTMTVDFGAATGGTLINDGVFLFDSDGDPAQTPDAIGYCVTYQFDVQGCDPVPYPGTINLLCPDGTSGNLELGMGPIALTPDVDIVGAVFGVAGGGAFYPVLTPGTITPAVCPAADGTGGVAAFVEVTAPDGTVCATVTGETPTACDGTNTTDTAVPVQVNPLADPLLSALFGAGNFAQCGIDATADLTYACNTCDAACPDYNAISVAAGCNVFDICIGYVDTDMDGIGDGGEDPTGTTMTVDFGAATGGTLINDGVFLFDSDGDPAQIPDAIGYCVTYQFDVQGCAPVPYPGTINLLCPDGTSGNLELGMGPIALTPDVDIVGAVFGVAGGGAFYPVLTATTTAAVCPAVVDESDAVAAFTEITAPDGTVCATVTGEVPTCGGTGGDAATVIQLNPLADPLLSALFGAGNFAQCGIDETADHSFTCAACGACAITPDAAINIVCDDNGTPDDPADDTYTFDILVNGSNTDPAASNTFNDDQGNTGIAYGTTVSYGPFPISGGDITVNFTDVDDAACVAMMMAAAPMTCSGATCSITPDAATNIVCDDAGTPGDPSDDTYTFDILVNGSSTFTGATNTFSDDQGNAGIAYGTTVSYGPFPISGGNTTVNFTDTETAACTGMMMATAPATCSNAMCSITPSITMEMCVDDIDDPTPEDPSDDVTTFTVTVNGSNPAGSGMWSDDQGNSGAYGGTATYTITGPGSLTVTYTDADDGTCTETITLSTIGCATVENIPTVGEWGLIILGLMMSITAIVGIRQRREEEATA